MKLFSNRECKEFMQSEEVFAYAVLAPVLGVGSVERLSLRALCEQPLFHCVVIQASGRAGDKWEW